MVSRARSQPLIREATDPDSPCPFLSSRFEGVPEHMYISPRYNIPTNKYKVKVRACVRSLPRFPISQQLVDAG